jgi:hypothetical protein
VQEKSFKVIIKRYKAYLYHEDFIQPRKRKIDLLETKASIDANFILEVQFQTKIFDYITVVQVLSENVYLFIFFLFLKEPKK